MTWQDLARAVVSRRVELGHHTRQSFADATGISLRTLGDVESARRESYAPDTLARLEQALGWPVGHAETLVAQVLNEQVRAELERLFAALPSNALDGSADVPPLAVEVIRYLDPDGPLTAEQRARFTAALELIVEAARAQALDKD